MLVVTCILGGTLATGSVGAAAGAARRATTTTSTLTGRVVPTVARAKSVKVTRVDDGRHYQLDIGDRLDVHLSGPAGVTWTEPASSSPALLRRVGGSAGLKASAAFSGSAKGTVTVTASGDNENCPACLGPIFGFEVTVSVVH
jgi:hypothetical protein